MGLQTCDPRTLIFILIKKGPHLIDLELPPPLADSRPLLARSGYVAHTPAEEEGWDA